MDTEPTQHPFSAMLFSLLPNDWNVQLFPGAGKQFIYLIPCDSDLNQCYLHTALHSAAPGAHGPHAAPGMAKRSWLFR